MTYLVPSGSTTSPSFPDWFECSVLMSFALLSNVSTVLSPMLITTMLPAGSSATPFGCASGAPLSKIEGLPSGVTLYMRCGSRVFET